MDILIFSPELRLSAVWDGARRVRAAERFCGAGSLEIRADAAEAARFAIGSVAVVPGMGEAYVIESIRTDSGAGTAVIAGRGVLSYLARRVLSEEITRAGNAETILCDLAEVWGAAVVPGTLTVVRQGIAGDVNAASSRGELLNAMEEICTAVGLGMRLDFDADGGGFRFTVRPRREVPLFLSRSAGNLLGIRRQWDFSGYYNRAIVLGNGGNLVTVDAAGLFDDGVDDAAQPLCEIWENATELAMNRYETEAAYREALAARGQRILAAHRPRIRASVETTSAGAEILMPGDVCTVADLHAQALCTAKTVTVQSGRTTRAVELSILHPGAELP